MYVCSSPTGQIVLDFHNKIGTNVPFVKDLDQVR